MYNIYSLIKAANGEIKADLVIKNINIINVFSQEIEMGDIAIHEGKVVGIGKYEGEKEIDCTGMYASPGLIDSHVHVESSMMTPQYFSRALLEKGITSAIADPHEIANVLGIKGIEFMLEESEGCGMDLFYMAPSCVPAVAFEESGAKLDAEELISLKKYKRIAGLAEVMDVEAVISCREDMIKKLENFSDLIIDGHAPLLSREKLNAYITAGVKTDHECTNVEEALEKIRKGMYVLIREGSAAKNLSELLPAVTDLNYHRFLFCTDDRHADDLLEEGSIDNVVRKAIAHGLNPVRALTIASFNAAKAYNLKEVGAVAPGYKADIIIFSDINKFELQYVIKNGKIAHFKENTSDSNNVKESSSTIDKSCMNISDITSEQLRVQVKGSTINVIEAVQGSLTTKVLVCDFEEENGFIKRVNSKDVLKIAVFERHKGTGHYYVGYIKGLGINDCAIAQTISHDSHNIIVVGEKDEDMLTAANELIKSGGGIAIAAEGVIKGLLELPIGGLMKAAPVEKVARELKELRAVLKQFNRNEGQDIFLTLSFMSLPVIPHIKITPKGLFEYDSFSFIDLFNN
jgi:adenine deaminase